MGNCHSDEVHGFTPGGLLKRPKFASRKASSQLHKSTRREATKDCGERNDPFHDFTDNEEEGSALLLHSKSNIFKAQREFWDTTKHWDEEIDSKIDRTLSLSMDDSFSQEREIHKSGDDRLKAPEDDDEEEEEAYIILRPDSETASTLTFVSNDSLETEGTKTSIAILISSEKSCLAPLMCKEEIIDSSRSNHGQESVELEMDDVLLAFQTAIKTCKEEIHKDLSPKPALK